MKFDFFKVIEQFEILETILRNLMQDLKKKQEYMKNVSFLNSTPEETEIIQKQNANICLYIENTKILKNCVKTILERSTQMYGRKEYTPYAKAMQNFINNGEMAGAEKRNTPKKLILQALDEGIYKTHAIQNYCIARQPSLRRTSINSALCYLHKRGHIKKNGWESFRPINNNK